MLSAGRQYVRIIGLLLCSLGCDYDDNLVAESVWRRIEGSLDPKLK